MELISLPKCSGWPFGMKPYGLINFEIPEKENLISVTWFINIKLSKTARQIIAD